jgi:hypothetical protein
VFVFLRALGARARAPLGRRELMRRSRGEEARRRRLGVLRMWWFIGPFWILGFSLLFFVFVL